MDRTPGTKRKGGNAADRKQRSILEFFKTPPLELGSKRRKVTHSASSTKEYLNSSAILLRRCSVGACGVFQQL